MAAGCPAPGAHPPVYRATRGSVEYPQVEATKVMVFSPSRYAATKLPISRTASSLEAPVATQPGRSGTYAA